MSAPLQCVSGSSVCTTCLGFFEGVSVDDAVAQSGIVDPALADPGDPFDDFSRLPMNPVAVFPSHGWTIV